MELEPVMEVETYYTPPPFLRKMEIYGDFVIDISDSWIVAAVRR